MTDINDGAKALLASNAIWADKISKENPDFFPTSASQPQTPHVRISFVVVVLKADNHPCRLFGLDVPIRECPSQL